MTWDPSNLVFVTGLLVTLVLAAVGLVEVLMDHPGGDMSKSKDCGYAELAIRAARAELERDRALEERDAAREESTRQWKAYSAVMTQDPEAMLEHLHIMGIPARDLKELYEMEGRRNTEQRLRADLEEATAWIASVHTYVSDLPKPNTRKMREELKTS